MKSGIWTTKETPFIVIKQRLLSFSIVSTPPSFIVFSYQTCHQPFYISFVLNDTLYIVVVLMIHRTFFKHTDSLVLTVNTLLHYYLRQRFSTDLQGLELHTGSFTLKQIRAATNNFDSANKIGEGGFGPVYKVNNKIINFHFIFLELSQQNSCYYLKPYNIFNLQGHLLDGTVIAVKQLSKKSKQGNREFVTEIGMISALQHPNLVKLYGCCIEGDELLLVYEYLENNSLARALFGNSAASCFTTCSFNFDKTC